ncbi:MAG TPA: ABC transporter permease [Thermoleophilaceae bacterium]|nr:ABC transporter permease [Thermoleophilaceae bacterium]
MTAEPLGTPITGPTALGDSFRRFAQLSWTLAVTDFKLRFFGSVLGYLWQLMRPLLLFGVLYFVFTQFVRIGGGVDFFPVVLLTNIVLFTFFAEGTGAVNSVVERENLVRKIQFPRLAIPVSTVLTAAFNLTLNAVVILIFALASGVRPHSTWLLLPVFLLALILLVLGFAMLLSALFVRYRDVKPIWEVVLQMTFYGTPIIYAIETIDAAAGVKEAIMLNPLAAIVQEVRHAVIDPDAPTAFAIVGNDLLLLIPAATIVGVFALGFWVFSREAPRIAEEL